MIFVITNLELVLTSKVYAFILKALTNEGGFNMKQLKIAIFCSGGFSTSLIGSKMQKVYDAEGADVKVDAYDFGMVDEVGDDVDVILLAPQIGWAYDQTKEAHPDTKVILLTMQQFGSMDGQVLVDVLKEKGIG